MPGVALLCVCFLATSLPASSVRPPTPSDIVISELMYYPPVPTTQESAAASGDQNEYEFVELLNISADTLDLNGLAFTDGIGFAFVGTLGPGEYILVVKDQLAFTTRYGSNVAAAVVGEYTGRLANEGERLTLTHNVNGVLRLMVYGIAAPWPPLPSLSSGGYSLELDAPFTSPDHAMAASWRRSDTPAGTPGGGFDEDMDGLPDTWEREYFGNLDETGSGDPDGDGSTNQQEFMHNTHPGDPDTDGDGLLDGVETNTRVFVDGSDTGTDPNSVDTDNDGLPDSVETATGEFVSLLDTGTDPNLADTDGDQFGDLLELNVGKDPLDPESFPVEPRIHFFVAAPSPVAHGEPVTLFWLAEDADAVFIDQGIGPVIQERGSLIVTPSAPFFWVPFESFWRYRDDGLDLGTDWRAPGHEDQFWSVGRARLGFGDAIERTVLRIDNSTSLSHPTYYFRKMFYIPDGAVPAALNMDLVRDDGAVVYLNGVEVRRDNMPATPVSFNTLALMAVGSPEETQAFRTSIDPSPLVEGTNVLAVEVHQSDLLSSDLGFDLALSTQDAASGVFRFTLTASNAYRRVTEQAAVFIIPEAPPVIESFIATPTTLLPGEQATLSWNVSGELRSLRLDPDIGQVTGTSINVRPILTVEAIPAGSSWLFLDDGSDQGTDWITPGYNDSAWAEGIGPLGYGNDGLGTFVGFGGDQGNKHITTYFRKHFVIADATLIQSAVVRLMRDDGAVVYLNGQEIIRDNMPLGPVTYQTWAAEAALDDGQVYSEFTVPGTRFNSGENILAVEIHQINPTSADIQFDLGLNMELMATTQVTYTLTARNDAGSDSAQVTVFVVPRAVELISLHDTWRYADWGEDPGGSWRELDYDDSTWSQGSGVFGHEFAGAAVPLIRTEILPPAFGGPITAYFRKRFTLPVPVEAVNALRLIHLVDDGAVIYLNGQEAHRIAVPPGQDYETRADRAVGNADFEGPFLLDTSLLREGENVVALELHQVALNTSDAVWGGLLQILVGETGEPVILIPPTDQVAREGSAVEFKALVQGQTPLAVQWRHESVPLPGALTQSLAIDSARPSDAGDYDVIVSNALGTTTSVTARLTVIPDLLPPGVLSADMNLRPDLVVVTFSEPVDAALAAEPARYEIWDERQTALPVLGAFMISDHEVGLTVQPRQDGLNYELIVRDVPDRAAASNVLSYAALPIQYRVKLVPLNASWRFDDSGLEPEPGWNGAGFDDASWLSGEGPLGFDETPGLPVPLRTILVPPRLRGPVYHFRSPFFMTEPLNNGRIELRYLLDDGAVFYLNGQEIRRVGVPEQGAPPILANRNVAVAAFEGPFPMNSPALVTGTNWLAVEVHQLITNDLDVVMGVELTQHFPSLDFFGPSGLEVARQGDDLVVFWTVAGYVLESAPGINGPWEHVSAPEQTVLVAPTEAQRFFRLRWNELTE